MVDCLTKPLNGRQQIQEQLQIVTNGTTGRLIKTFNKEKYIDHFTRLALVLAI